MIMQKFRYNYIRTKQGEIVHLFLWWTNFILCSFYCKEFLLILLKSVNSHHVHSEHKISSSVSLCQRQMLSIALF